MLTVPLFINGKEVTTSKTIDIFSPATGELLHKASCADVSDATKAIEAAQAAFPAWSKTSPYEKRDIFLKAASIFESRIDELTKIEEEEIAASQFFARNFDGQLALNGLKDVAGRIASISGSIPVVGNGERGALVVKEPYGVVLGIAPWNAAYILGFRAVTFAIAAGNTVVFKGAESCPRVVNSIASVFHEAGLPAGVLNTLITDPSDAPAVIKEVIAHPYVRKVNFTGSTNVGRIIAKQCAEHIKPCLLELGGKAPAIVLEDADLKLAAKECALGAYLNAGQICMSTERIIVHKSVSDEFIKEFKGASGQIFPDSLTVISKASYEKNTALLEDAKKKGAEVIFGGKDASAHGKQNLHPTALKGLTKDMDLYYTESFGPSVTILEVETEEEAVAIANDTEYGLTSAVFTKDLSRGLRIAEKIDSGAVHINSMSVHDEPNLPHGGAKSSGFGRFGSQGLEEWVKTKTITFAK